MKQVSELQNTLSHFLNWNKARLACLSQILWALLQVRTVNLTQIAAAFQAEAKEESSYRRICRFFTDFSFDMSSIVSIVLKLFPLEGKFLLILDRTNWKWGKSPINILMLSLGYKGISIPLFWTVLDLEGNSSADDRIAIVKRVLEKLGLERILAFTADREFIGKVWFDFLVEQKIPFIIRVKKNFIVEDDEGGRKTSISTLCKGLGRKKILNRSVVLWGIPLYISMQKRKGAKEAMIIASNIPFKNPLEIYKRRWEIETLFGCLKTRGFRMEDTHMTDGEKIEKLIFVLAIAFCWAYRVGDITAKTEPIPIKTHGRPAKSLFREGLDRIRRLIFKCAALKDLRRLLSCFYSLNPGGCSI